MGQQLRIRVKRKARLRRIKRLKIRAKAKRQAAKPAVQAAAATPAT